MSHVYDMCFLPPSERDALEPPLLAVLHKLEREKGGNTGCVCGKVSQDGKDRGGGAGCRVLCICHAASPAGLHITTT